MSKLLSRLPSWTGALSTLLLLIPAPLMASEGEIVSTTDPVSQGIVAVVVVTLFVLLAREAAHRVLIALVSAAFLWMMTYLTPWHLISFEASARHLDVNVFLLLGRHNDDRGRAEIHGRLRMGGGAHAGAHQGAPPSGGPPGGPGSPPCCRPTWTT